MSSLNLFSRKDQSQSCVIFILCFSFRLCIHVIIVFVLVIMADSLVKSSHYYLYSAFNNANCVKSALHQLDIKLGGSISALQYLDGGIVCQNIVILLWPDKISL